MVPIGFERHDHADCVEAAIAAADARCTENGLRLTPIRRRVLEILLSRHCAIGAYDILDILKSDGVKAQPPLVYRALDFLTGHGFAHRVERLNAFVACAVPGQRHAPVLLICRTCARVAETHAEDDTALGRATRDSGFVVERAVMEAEGLCPTCQENAT
ncbi:Zinc uptake regulation protein [Jannaschia seosinensis]|uniref:Zinc uptake regulation protein n=1 Tax=Jannaschia seosinensis TaxID=313367 RepID=A0A0M7BEW6_9RHOB|nr:transcriptional repressor [Jannaschia seosinensis]CUH40394.1 Zinc uptake regulation protein [Jannaschia seosinensis]